MLDDVREELFARIVGADQLEFRMVPHASHTFDLLGQLVEHEVDNVILEALSLANADFVGLWVPEKVELANFYRVCGR